jgi:hypothetical protein
MWMMFAAKLNVKLALLPEHQVFPACTSSGMYIHPFLLGGWPRLKSESGEMIVCRSEDQLNPTEGYNVCKILHFLMQLSQRPINTSDYSFASKKMLA